MAKWKVYYDGGETCIISDLSRVVSCKPDNTDIDKIERLPDPPPEPKGPRELEIKWRDDGLGEILISILPFEHCMTYRCGGCCHFRGFRYKEENEVHKTSVMLNCRGDALCERATHVRCAARGSNV